MGWEVKDGPGGTFYFFTERTNCIKIEFLGGTLHIHEHGHIVCLGVGFLGSEHGSPFQNFGENDGKSDRHKRET